MLRCHYIPNYSVEYLGKEIFGNSLTISENIPSDLRFAHLLIMIAISWVYTFINRQFGR